MLTLALLITVLCQSDVVRRSLKRFLKIFFIKEKKVFFNINSCVAVNLQVFHWCIFLEISIFRILAGLKFSFIV